MLETIVLAEQCHKILTLLCQLRSNASTDFLFIYIMPQPMIASTFPTRIPNLCKLSAPPIVQEKENVSYFSPFCWHLYEHQARLWFALISFVLPGSPQVWPTAAPYSMVLVSHGWPRICSELLLKPSCAFCGIFSVLLFDATTLLIASF